MGGSATRENMDRVHLAKYYTNNLPTRTLLGGAYNVPEPSQSLQPAEQRLSAAPPQQEPSRASLSRALEVALHSAKPEKRDPMLTAALITLKARVAQLDRQRQSS